MLASRRLVEEILRKVSEYQNQPSANRVFFLWGPPQLDKTTVAKEVALGANGTFVDPLADKLSTLDPVIGAYKPKDFQRDVIEWARTASCLLVIDETEPLFDTWRRDQQEDAIKLLSGLTARTDCPVLITTRIPLNYAQLVGNREKVFAALGR
jgi:hypothetical protein